MTDMRAKMRLHSVTDMGTAEMLSFQAVAAKSYGEDGADEDNTYAKFSPSATLQITVMNPALLGKFKPGQSYYVDFTRADTPASE